MSLFIAKINTNRPTNQLQIWFETAGGKVAIGQRVVDYVQRVVSGNESAAGTSSPPSIAMSIQALAIQASGTLTLSSTVATNAFTVNGVTFTCVASGAGANQFNVGADDTATAVNAAAAINASVSALVAGYVTASSALGVVTVTAVDHGIFGNLVTITGTTNIVASGARLTGGIADPTAQTISF